LSQNAQVEDAALADASPGSGIGKAVFQVEDNEGKMVDRGVDFFRAGYDFVNTMGMKIVDGRNFSRDVVSDTVYGAIVNEAMVKRMGWDEPIGKRLILAGGDIEKRVVGVVQDYHQNSLYDVI